MSDKRGSGLLDRRARDEHPQDGMHPPIKKKIWRTRRGRRWPKNENTRIKCRQAKLRVNERGTLVLTPAPLAFDAGHQVHCFVVKAQTVRHCRASDSTESELARFNCYRNKRARISGRFWPRRAVIIKLVRRLQTSAPYQPSERAA